MKQQKGEFLRDYAARFNAATLEVKNFNESVAMIALKQRFKSNCLIFSLNKKYLDNYEQMLIEYRSMHRLKKKKAYSVKQKRKVEKSGLKKKTTKNSKIILIDLEKI